MGVYTIAGGKGGVGKSTTAASLGVALSEAGYSVALVDADLAMANLADICGVDYRRGIHHVLAGQASVEDVVVKVSDGLGLVPGGQRLELFEAADPANLRDVVDPLVTAADIVLVDTGAGLDHEALVATGLADGTVLVTTPDDQAVRNVAKTAEFVDNVDSTVFGAVVTRVTDETDLGRVAADLDLPVLGAIPEGNVVGTEPLTTGDAGRAYRRLAATLLTQSQEDTRAIGAPASVDWTPVSASGGRIDEETDSEFGSFRGLFSLDG